MEGCPTTEHGNQNTNWPNQNGDRDTKETAGRGYGTAGAEAALRVRQPQPAATAARLLSERPAGSRARRAVLAGRGWPFPRSLGWPARGMSLPLREASRLRACARALASRGLRPWLLPWRKRGGGRRPPPARGELLRHGAWQRHGDGGHRRRATPEASCAGGALRRRAGAGPARGASPHQAGCRPCIGPRPICVVTTRGRPRVAGPAVIPPRGASRARDRGPGWPWVRDRQRFIWGPAARPAWAVEAAGRATSRPTAGRPSRCRRGPGAGERPSAHSAEEPPAGAARGRVQ
jgi:hypothetical protein